MKRRPSEALELNRDEVLAIFARSRFSNPRVFGSVLHGDDTTDSDLDLLVDREGPATLFDLGRLGYKLQQLLGCKVDILTPKALPERWRQRVIDEARPVDGEDA